MYADFIGGATDWLPINKGDTIGVNLCRASINFVSAAQSTVTKTAVAPEANVLLEMKMFGGDADAEAWPIDQWQGVLVATSRRAHRAGWVRMRIVNINNGDGTGVAMALQISRTGDCGAVT
ncbi:MAG: hypothetical protein AAGL98_00125 [Planctomycetota bacterium]